MVAALKEPIVESDDENEDGTDAESEGPLYQLFDALYNEPNSSGMHLFTCFFRMLWCF